MSHVKTLGNNMDHRNGEKHMSNTRLVKFLVLNHILNPKAVKVCGFNVYNVVIVFLILYLGMISVIACFNGLYYWTNHRTEAILHLGSAEIFLYSCYKMSILVFKSKKIRDCFSITRFDFMPYSGCRDIHLLETWRNRIILFTSVFASGNFFVFMMYVLSPVIFRNMFVTIKSLDGTQSDYRINLFNLYATWSAETYNTHFGIFYLVEATGLLSFMIINVAFDTLLITLCLAFVGQLQVINAAFKSSGPKRFCKDSVQSKNDDKIGLNIYLYTPYEHFLAYNELKTIIMDHQSVIKNLDTFFSTFKLVLLSQIIVSTSANIVVLVNLSTNFVEGEMDNESTFAVMKMICACPYVIFQLFIICYLIESLQNQKESIGFALYSSNWTEMDMKCRRLILLAMRMNNAHKRKLKFSQLKIVNLEMFFVTMRICYSVVSVVLNCKSN